MELVYNKSKPVAVTGMAFPTGDVNNFVVGSEEGTVYTACRHGRYFLPPTHLFNFLLYDCAYGISVGYNVVKRLRSCRRSSSD